MEEKNIIRDALYKEDRILHDLTSALVPDGKQQVKSILVAKSNGVICGTKIVASVFREISSVRPARIKILIPDGAKVKSGDKILLIEAPARVVLAGERTALNFIQRLSGIATLTSRFVAKAGRYGVKIYDTRKTTPSLRALEKYAVRCGGGVNHRMNLAETVFVKDNHRVLCPDVYYWVKEARRKYGKNIPVEIECDSVGDAIKCAVAGADIILLDNMPFIKLKTAIALIRKINPRIVIEVSGGINLDNVASIARLKPDRISVGALTHSAPSLDISLEIISHHR